MTNLFEQRVQDELDKKPLKKRETDVRFTFQELETLLALFDGVPIEASQSELWCYMNTLEIKLLEAKSRVQGDVFTDVIDSKAKEDRKTP